MGLPPVAQVVQHLSVDELQVSMVPIPVHLVETTRGSFLISDAIQSCSIKADVGICLNGLANISLVMQGVRERKA